MGHSNNVRKKDRTDRQTDEQTDGCQTATLCLLLDMASITSIRQT